MEHVNEGGSRKNDCYYVDILRFVGIYKPLASLELRKNGRPRRCILLSGSTFAFPLKIGKSQLRLGGDSE